MPRSNHYFHDTLTKTEHHYEQSGDGCSSDMLFKSKLACVLQNVHLYSTLFKITSNDACVLFLTFHKNLLHSSSDQPHNI